MSHPHTDSFNDEKSFRRSADYNCELHVDMFLLHFMKYWLQQAMQNPSNHFELFNKKPPYENEFRKPKIS